jgi:hypothetical protein
MEGAFWSRRNSSSEYVSEGLGFQIEVDRIEELLAS